VLLRGEANVEKDSLAILATFRHPLGLMEKQIRLLAELADASPMVDQKEGPEVEAEFVIVHRQRMRELIEQLRLQVAVMRSGLDATAFERFV
jgi:hypothetical protein